MKNGSYRRPRKTVKRSEYVSAVCDVLMSDKNDFINKYNLK